MENPFLVFVAGADGLERKTTFAQESSVKEVDSKSLSCHRYNSIFTFTTANKYKTTVTTTATKTTTTTTTMVIIITIILITRTRTETTKTQ